MLAAMNAHQYQQYLRVAAAPAGWKGAWPPMAPGGPPPPPQGINVDPKMWVQGQWQFNPAYRTVASTQAQVWAPHPIWQQQAAQAAPDYNPYKRKPNPGDAAYWATKLSDNPLGLHNMHIREENPKTQVQHTVELPQTPWVWVPDLSKSPERHEQPLDSHDNHGVRETQGTHGSQQSQPVERSQEVSSVPSGTHQLTDGQKALFRSKREWGVEDHHKHKERQAKIASERGPQGVAEDRNRRWEAVIAYWDLSEIQWKVTDSQMNHLFEEMEKEKVYASRQPQRQGISQQTSSSSQQAPQHSSAYRNGAQSAVTPHPVTHSSAPATNHSGALQEQQARAFEERKPEANGTSRRASEDRDMRDAPAPPRLLEPTFSPGIVRTPQHYSSASASAAAAVHSLPSMGQPSTPTPSSRTSQDRPLQPSPRTHGPIYGPPTPRNSTPSRSNSESSAHTTPSRQSSSSSVHSRGGTGPSPLSYLPTFSEEPADELLSPLMSSSTPQASFDRPTHERSGSESRSGRELSRSQTVPTFSSSSSYSAIAEERSPRSPPTSSSASRTPRPSPHPPPPSSYPAAYRDDASTPTPSSRRSPGDVRTLGRSQTMPTNIDAQTPAQHSHSRSTSSSRMTSPASSPNAYQQRSRSPHTPSPRSRRPSRSPLRNPLPSPPVPSSYTSNTWQQAEKNMAAMTINGSSRTHSHPLPDGYSSSREQHQQQPRSQSYPQPAHAQPAHTPRPSQSAYPSTSPYPSRSTAMSSASASASSSARAQAMSRQDSSGREREREREERERERDRERKREEENLRTRWGFWNKRGDYLYLVGRGADEKCYIVYAPRECANPPELRDYPQPTQGFMDHHEKFIKYDPTIPEYPDSLPKHGNPPVRPYESFVRYITD